MGGKEVIGQPLQMPLQQPVDNRHGNNNNHNGDDKVKAGFVGKERESGFRGGVQQ